MRDEMVAAKWTCPLCGSRHYRRVVLSRGKQEYESQFFVCLGCSITFTEPALIADAAKVKELFPGKPNPMLHDVSNEALAVERRFWEARARRFSGGIEPSHERVVELWRRGRLD